MVPRPAWIVGRRSGELHGSGGVIRLLDQVGARCRTEMPDRDAGPSVGPLLCLQTSERGSFPLLGEVSSKSDPATLFFSHMAIGCSVLSRVHRVRALSRWNVRPRTTWLPARCRCARREFGQRTTHLRAYSHVAVDTGRPSRSLRRSGLLDGRLLLLLRAHSHCRVLRHLDFRRSGENGIRATRFSPDWIVFLPVPPTPFRLDAFA